MNDIPVYYVIGHPIGHSMSPFIHEQLFRLQTRKAVYTSKDIPPECLDSVLTSLLQDADGLNVTIPFKQAVIPFLDGLRGRAKLYRSVNTILTGKGGCYGYNTDADGFLCALKEGGIPLKGRVALLGCGGVGRTFACEAALAGCAIVNAVRDSSRPKAEELKQFVQKLVPSVSYEITSLNNLSGDFDLLINATPSGMYPNCSDCPVKKTVLAHSAAVFDAVYNPRDTLLLSYAKAAGAHTVGGMQMLVWQAAKAHEIWYQAQFQPGEIAQLIADADQKMKRLFSE